MSSAVAREWMRFSTNRRNSSRGASNRSRAPLVTSTLSSSSVVWFAGGGYNILLAYTRFFYKRFSATSDRSRPQAALRCRFGHPGVEGHRTRPDLHPAGYFSELNILSRIKPLSRSSPLFPVDAPTGEQHAHARTHFVHRGTRSKVRIDLY